VDDGVTLGQVAARFGLVLQGDPDVRITHVATLQGAGPGALSFFSNPRYRRQLRQTAATAVVLDERSVGDSPTAVLVSDNPYAAYARIATWLYPVAPLAPGIHPTAVIDPTARVAASAEVAAHVVVGAGAEIGERAVVGAGTFLGDRVRIGADTWLAPRVTLYAGVRMGARCIIHSGTVLGADGFGIAQDRGRWVKVPQLGSVLLGDDVEIGANTTIDRGAIEDTVIEDDVKIDNQVQIGHNVRIGAHTAIAGCVGISGSTSIGKRCMIAGASGVAGHLEIADDVVVLGLTMVSRSIEKAGVYSSGLPASEAGDWRRTVARLRHLDELFDRVRTLEGQDDGPELEHS
jgi:UDP-3-O-[3-hydroxymyristoyl] glucosamine N-acyltransferase